MKNCLECQKSFLPNRSFTKYCSFECSRRYNNKKTVQRRKNDPEYKKKFREEENARKKRKYYADPVYRAKRLGKEWARRRKCSPLKIAPSGSGHITIHGYKQIIRKDHPNSWRGGAIFEHIVIMSNHIGRALLPKETVHHKNGIRNDNRIENLELWSSSHPPGQRIEDKIQWCREFLEIYGFNVIKKVK